MLTLGIIAAEQQTHACHKDVRTYDADRYLNESAEVTARLESSIITTTMVQLQVSSQYHSRDGLLRFLRAKFGNDVNFKIKETGDGHFTFEAPRDLTPVSSLRFRLCDNLLNSTGGVDVSVSTFLFRHQ